MDNQILEVLDHPGLQQYDGEIKDYIHNQIDSVETLGIQYNEEESALEFVGDHPKVSGNGGNEVNNGKTVVFTTTSQGNGGVYEYNIESNKTMDEINDLYNSNDNVKFILKNGNDMLEMTPACMNEYNGIFSPFIFVGFSSYSNRGFAGKNITAYIVQLSENGMHSCSSIPITSA